jgi:hypothetical protein
LHFNRLAAFLDRASAMRLCQAASYSAKLTVGSSIGRICKQDFGRCGSLASESATFDSRSRTSLLACLCFRDMIDLHHLCRPLLRNDVLIGRGGRAGGFNSTQSSSEGLAALPSWKSNKMSRMEGTCGHIFRSFVCPFPDNQTVARRTQRQKNREERKHLKHLPIEILHSQSQLLRTRLSGWCGAHTYYQE